MTVKLKIKKTHPDAIIPQFATDGAACFDLHAIEVHARVDIDFPLTIHTGVPRSFHTGLSFEVPEGHVMLIFSRSGHGFKHDTRLSNCVGVIDCDYRGEVMVSLSRDNSMEPSLIVNKGDRIAQAMVIPLPKVAFEVVQELEETQRGNGGFGSTGA